MAKAKPKPRLRRRRARTRGVEHPVASPVVITGAGGMLGYDLVRAFQSAIGTEAIALDHAALDVTDAAQIAAMLKRLRPRWVVNAAAYTQVDGAETDRESALRLNATAPALLAEACAQAGARLVHFSTDQVFDGQGHMPRVETDPPAPLNYYAETKLLGEKAVLRERDALCLRVQWLYGARKDRFTPLRDRAVFTPIADQFGAPTWTLVLAGAVVELCRREARGLFHFAHDDFGSWAEVFAYVKQVLRLPLRLDPVWTGDLKLPARRPLFTVLNNRKLCQELGVTGLGDWRVPLGQFLKLSAR